ncbi:hypothetical protein IC762_05110 [Bradyrhizobium genosp. L]|uniref:hypothetical protein n=1 Tax=Bradyrhizobium genosp. L TaxID=83637 RepID=UPI0018A29792|nr:hypothetical protein [Bradyrhizobium genosp. L]QPF85693.1 hypothetical protein IC762_05110 [Bradyrhizobium genosp. L]
MFKNKLAVIIVTCVAIAPVQLLAQGTGGTPLPSRPGDRAPPSGVSGSALPAKAGQRVGTTGTGGTALPANPGDVGGGASTLHR